MDIEQTKQNYRGKLYALSQESAWEDTGTGFASITGSGNERRLLFREEETGKVLHDRPVFDSSVYQLQGEGERQTIIVWEDAETQKDWALSFQCADGTAEIWEAICGDVDADEKRVLPLPTLATLSDLSRMLTSVPPTLREVFAIECLSAKFLNSLRETFHTAEDVCSEEALVALWQIAKGIFLLSNQKLTERYLRRDAYVDVFGMLEYDAGLPAEKRIAHRQVLQSQVRFKSVLTFEDVEAVERIHLVYRLQYLKDIALPRLLDDAAFVSLTQMIHMNLSLTIDHLQKSDRLLDQLFAQISNMERPALHFLQEVSRLAKQIAPSERQALHEKFAGHNMFALIVPFFRDDGVDSDASLGTRHICVELLLLSAQSDASHLRRFLTSDNSIEGRALLSALISTVHSGNDHGAQGQAAELLKLVMDVMMLETREREACLDAFYDRGALDELTAALRTDATNKNSRGPCTLFGQQLSCELLAFAVLHHGFRARAYVMRHGVLQHTMRLLSSPQRFLQLAPVRLLQAAIGSKDDAYHRYLAKCGFFGPLLHAFELSVRPPALGGNLLVSATLQVLEFIRIENIKVLVGHIGKKHEAILREFAPKYSTLELFLVKHKQNLEYEAFPPERHSAGPPLESNGRGTVGTARSGRMRSPGREDSDDDEAYFEDEDEETCTGPAHNAEIVEARSRTASPERSLDSGGAAYCCPPVVASRGADSGANVAPGLPGLLVDYADEDEKGVPTDDQAPGGGAAGEPGCEDRSEPTVPLTTQFPAVAILASDPSHGRAGPPNEGDSGRVDEVATRVPSDDGAVSEVAVADDANAEADRQPERCGADACAAAAERVLGHAPKRLKTSPAAVEASA
mmetsp:Transcript_126581/g.364093  ORF Transcript_126581/g.364093 Transcript_126581/m.364093 type:complete len:857 (-) Transcript_126581:405-2975(-)|eukprot:CAMPEP_0170205118 /NCGR_PEP_ID=MMETSP0116_2-20130129/2096_1 /TAXON_ID=400756 /ORGANISM="Durinskia baltica, Strain CSIRO CS-38" /LENGTH=856 /DNA_ID=CAMNT_0010455495 /DNA_START=79 /DNA_END=2649 /DNA_ORIENTATION=+